MHFEDIRGRRLIGDQIIRSRGNRCAPINLSSSDTGELSFQYWRIQVGCMHVGRSRIIRIY